MDLRFQGIIVENIIHIIIFEAKKSATAIKVVIEARTFQANSIMQLKVQEDVPTTSKKTLQSSCINLKTIQHQVSWHYVTDQF